MSDMDAPRNDPLVPLTADIWVRLSRLPQLLGRIDKRPDEPAADDETR